MNNNAMSKTAAEANLRKFFAKTPVSVDTVAIDDIFVAVNRDPVKLKQNRLWLANKLTAMRDYNLIERKYSLDGKKKRLIALKLTAEGKKALGRIQEASAPEQPIVAATTSSSLSDEVTLETVYAAVKALRAKMPSFDIVFDIKPKE